jgi:hypothetical protein
MDDLLAEEITNFVMRDLKSKNSHVNNSTTDGSAQDAVNNIKDLVRKARGKAPKQRYNEQEIKDLEAHVQNLQTDLDECRQKIIDDVQAKKTLQNERDDLADDSDKWEAVYRHCKEKKVEKDRMVLRENERVGRKIITIMEGMTTFIDAMNKMRLDRKGYHHGDNSNDDDTNQEISEMVEKWHDGLNAIVMKMHGEDDP